MGGGRKNHGKERLCEEGRHKSGGGLDEGSPMHVSKMRRQEMLRGSVAKQEIVGRGKAWAKGKAGPSCRTWP